MKQKDDLYIEESILVTISEDQIYAYIEILKIRDTPLWTVDQLEQLLYEHGVVYGIEEAVLLDICQNPKDFLHKQTIVAKGDVPQDGVDGHIEYAFDLDHQGRKPRQLEDGKVDYKEIISINNVQKGQRLARIISATEGLAGKSVIGKVLLANPGKAVRFQAGNNVVSDSDKTTLYAAIDGMVTMNHDKIHVFPVYDVSGDVDFSVGNIEFVGSVVIRGNVLNGFRVSASGDIRIFGGIEAAEVKAGGSIHIGAGIVGQGKAFVQAGKTIRCAFIQEGSVTAGEDVIVSRSIMHSQVRAGGSVNCHSSRGLIVGGIVQAKEKVVATTIGNMMSTATIIEVGVQPALRHDLQQLQNEQKLQNEQLTKTEKALNLLNQLAAQGALPSDKLLMRIKLNRAKKQAEEDLAQLQQRIAEMDQLLGEKIQAKIEVYSTIYAGVKLVIGRNTKVLNESITRASFFSAGGDISYSALI